MLELTRRGLRIGAALMLASLFLIGEGKSQTSEQFDPHKAFCDRQTFVLENVYEVAPWLHYIGGLRTARTQAPELNCASTTVRMMFNILSAQDEATAVALRAAFHQFYAARALEPETTGRVIDRDGSFRYLNDVTLASFAWLLCPGAGNDRQVCVRSSIAALTPEFIETSPVFCAFAPNGAKSDVEWPSAADAPLLCAPNGSDSVLAIDDWLEKLDAAVDN